MHSDWLHAKGQPAVNVKMQLIDLRRVKLPMEEGSVNGVTVYTDGGFTHDWIESNVNDEVREQAWRSVCEAGWEEMEREAKDIWGKATKVFAEGRSGGWAVVEGIKSFESWNVVDLAKWRRFEQHAQAVVADIPRSMVLDIYLNYFLEPEIVAAESSAL